MVRWQVVSPGSSTYLYDCCLRPDDVEFKVPHIGLGTVALVSHEAGQW